MNLSAIQNTTKMSAMSCIPRVTPLTGAPLAKHLERHASSDTTALVYNDETFSVRISYAELAARSNALARAIVARARPLGANRDGDFLVAICMQPTHNTIVTLLAALKAGAAYLPLEPSCPQERITHMMEDAAPALVIYDDSANPELFASSKVPAVGYEELAAAAAALSKDQLQELETLAVSDDKSIAIVMYTSGSTGVPKGVRLPYSAICNRLWWQFRTFPYSHDEVTCVWKTALTFGDSICEIWGPLLRGRTLLILPKETTRDPLRLVRVLAENQVQRLVLVPTLLRSILMSLSLNPSERPLQHLKLWVCSGEVLSKELAAEFFRYFGDQDGYKLANFYGSTEVSGDVTFYVFDTMTQVDMFTSIPIGAPLDNCAVYLLDEEMNPAKESEMGEIWVAGANLAAGYVGMQVPKKFCDNPHASHPDYNRLFRTGDYGILQKGVLLYAGRTDWQVKIRGQKVDLLEVEKAINAVQGVDMGVVVCYGSEQGNPEILAFATLKPTARLSEYQIEAALKNSLTHYMIPRVFVIDTIPLIVQGKVDRQALLKMYENTNKNDNAAIYPDIDYSGVEPKNRKAAEVLFETVGEVLGRSARGVLSVNADFYELGGNSLNSIYTITKLRDKGYFIGIGDFLNAANLGQVLSHMSTDPKDHGSKCCEPAWVEKTLEDKHKGKVVEMIVSSFYERAEVNKFQKYGKLVRDYVDVDVDCIEACWDALVDANLSVILEDSQGNPIAVALNFDAKDELLIDLAPVSRKFLPNNSSVGKCLAQPPGLNKFLARPICLDKNLSGPLGLANNLSFMKLVEDQIQKATLHEGKGQILHSFMMATSSSLSARENVSAICALELATIRIAREGHFAGVFTTNTSPLTQQLGTDVLGYKTLLDYKINRYVDYNAGKIFGEAPSDTRAVVCWKPVQ